MSKTTKIIIWFIVAIIVIVGIWYGVSRKPAEEEVIKIGAILPLTGDVSIMGEENLRGIELGKPDWLEVIYEDSKSDPKEGINAYNKLKNVDKINSVITAMSPISVPVAKNSNIDKVIQFGIVTWADSYRTPDDYTFRIDLTAENAVKKISEYIGKENFTRVAILYSQNEYGEAFYKIFKKELEKKNISLVAEMSHLTNEKDFRTMLTVIKDRNPEVTVIVPIFNNQIGLIIKQSYELGLKTQFIAGIPGAEDKVVLDIAGEKANGLIYIFPVDIDNTEVKRVIELYKEKFNEEPSNTYYLIVGYQAIKTISEGYKLCGYQPNSECVRNKFLQLKDFNTVFGKVSFDEYGDVDFRPILKIIKNGKFEKLMDK